MKSILKKTFGAAVVLLLAYLVSGSLDLVIHPTLGAELAVDQLANDEGAAMAMRSYNHAIALATDLIYCAAALVILFIFKQEIGKGFTMVKSYCADTF